MGACRWPGGPRRRRSGGKRHCSDPTRGPRIRARAGTAGLWMCLAGDLAQHPRERLVSRLGDRGGGGQLAGYAGRVGDVLWSGRDRRIGALLAATAAWIRRGVSMGRINVVLLAMLVAYAPSAAAQDPGDRQA